ncbi:hypothetical protein [Bdellovibrio sp. HCB2-146]|uniref:hypothetical protein n=1 Tax=Bdellovibrio sp. HCB2-146 TaxID=3394362 RepID=UPI0039BD1938
MKFWNQFKIAALVTLIASIANAQSVSFQNISDSVSGRNYDPASTVVDSTNSNKLLIGIHSGYDPVTWQNTAFIASTAGFHSRSVTDSLNVDIVAPAGYGIVQIIYRQDIAAFKSREGSYSSNITWTVDGAKQTVSALTPGSKVSTAQFEAPRASVRVTLNSSLSATDIRYITPYRFIRLGGASISILNPSLEVILAPM